ncbi:nucleotidyltransferase family protein [Paenibacillus sp. ACRRX]|uniref:nucleotidyltransferase family protein n=1 Tax=Paenibacillus sp. ACRRX TaxID=2918206 RepID=UPI001EF6F515|nr:nucleotidyltransferase family protein [Paenibacillus sp. ACRRX]MCG7407578.1 nucleotidyltransferase family protein [Paenibacillus sp. ACRRX]
MNRTDGVGRWSFNEAEQRILAWIAEDEIRMSELQAVREMNLPDWCIGAGYVRNLVWDKLHRYAEPTPLNDVDVVYYDSICTQESIEKQYEQAFQAKLPHRKWSFKNQARMHMLRRDEPFISTADAMMHWPELMTAVDVRMEADGALTFICPWGEQGLQDLMEMNIRQSPKFTDRAYYEARVRNKGWLVTWPHARMK